MKTVSGVCVVCCARACEETYRGAWRVCILEGLDYIIIILYFGVNLYVFLIF